MAIGTVELAGTAARDVELVDPIYLQPCAYYHIKVEEERGSGKHRRWITVYEKHTNGTPFYCQDSTGRVLVIPDSPEVHLSNKLTRRSSMLTSFSGSSDNLKLVAEIIREGDPLFVIGVAQPLPKEMRVGAGVSVREAAENLKKDTEKMKQIDANRDGHVDAIEWEMAVAKHKKDLDNQKALEESKTPKQVDLFTSTAFVSKGPGSKLVIANDEKELVARLGRYAFLEVIGGGGAIVFGIVQIFKLLRV
ncbi:MAG: GIDE domain-containing protein [Elusimicrobiota bacterium]